MRLATAALALALACGADRSAMGAWQIILHDTGNSAAGDAAPAGERGEATRLAARSPGPPPSVAGMECTVVTRPGDSLTVLAKRHLGDPNRWREIQELNFIREPDLIGAHWTLAVPCDGDGAKAPVAAGTPQEQEPDPDDLARMAEQAINEVADEGGDGKEAAAASTGRSSQPEAEDSPADDAHAKVHPDGTDGDGQTIEAAASRTTERDDRQPAPSPADVLAKACTAVVRAGDNLTVLAKRHLGDPNRWREIQELNGLREPDLIRVGQAIMLPCYPDAGAAPTDPQAQADGIPRLAGPAAHPPAGRWTASSGAQLDDVVSTWAIEAGWTPILTERWFWALDTDVSLDGTFIEAVEQLLGGFSAAGVAPAVTVYANQVLVLEFR